MAEFRKRRERITALLPHSTKKKKNEIVLERKQVPPDLFASARAERYSLLVQI